MQALFEDDADSDGSKHHDKQTGLWKMFLTTSIDRDVVAQVAPRSPRIRYLAVVGSVQ